MLDNGYRMLGRVMSGVAHLPEAFTLLKANRLKWSVQLVEGMQEEIYKRAQTELVELLDCLAYADLTSEERERHESLVNEFNTMIDELEVMGCTDR